MVARKYAAETKVPVEQTQAEIVRLLGAHGATARAVGIDDISGRGFIMFELAGRRIRHETPLPTVADLGQTKAPRGWRRWDEGRRQDWIVKTLEQEHRSAWRGLLLLLKAKLDAILTGATTVEREFLADVVLPSGKTVGQTIKAGIETAYLTGNVPPLLPAPSGSNGQAPTPS